MELHSPQAVKNPQNSTACRQPTLAQRAFQRLFIFILLCLIGAAAGGLSAHFQPKQWQAEAQTAAPVVSQLGNYYALSEVYAVVQGEPLNQTEQVYHAFRQLLQSPEVRRVFLSEHDLIKQHAATQKQLVEAILPDFLANFSLNLTAYPNPAAAQFDRIAVRAETAEGAKTLLNDYLQFVQRQAREQLNGELIARWKVKFDQVKFAAENALGAVQGNATLPPDWAGKLKLMKSVQPLDNNLQPFRLMQMPTVTQISRQSPLDWALLGAASGAFLAIFLFGFWRRR